MQQQKNELKKTYISIESIQYLISNVCMQWTIATMHTECERRSSVTLKAAYD